MRAVFVGASTLSVMTVRRLLSREHDVVVIEMERPVIDALAEDLDCGFLHGDGTRPAVLQEADPGGTDFLFCLTGNDQTNIIASLVGRSLGFKRVITKLEDEELEHICIELGLNEVIVPDDTIARRLVDILEGQDLTELALMIKGDARVFSFVARDDDACRLDELDLPARARVVCLYRDEDLLFPEPSTRIRANDEVVIISHREELPALSRRWNGPVGDDDHNRL